MQNKESWNTVKKAINSVSGFIEEVKSKLSLRK